MSDTTIVIPARLASQRFPGKVLADATGRPLIQHVYEAAFRATCSSDVIVATEDAAVVDAVEAFGGVAVMTRDDHPNGTSRIAEVAERLTSDIIVNVQGDEPELDPSMIDAAVETLRAHPDCPVATLASPIDDDADVLNPHIVKVVTTVDGRAMYFSRAPIPHHRDAHAPCAQAMKHVGLYVYRRAFLPTYVNLSPTPMEQSECLEQLRILEHGFSIAVGTTHAPTPGIDTLEQYEAFVSRWRAAQDNSSN